MFLVIFALLAFALILFLWGGSMLLQGWLYQNPADHMPIRAAIGGTVLAAFLTFWCYIDAKNPGKYDTLFEFSPLDVTDHDSFDAVMKKANGNEHTIAYSKRTGAKGNTADFSDAKGQPWKKNTNDSMCVAVLLHEPEKEEPTRFNATLDEKGNFPQQMSDLRYVDAAGRYMTADTLGRVYRKKAGVFFANIFLNLVHMLLWWAVLWFCLRFSVWHAFGLASVLWLFAMLAVQPVLFNQVRPRAAESRQAATAFLGPVRL